MKTRLIDNDADYPAVSSWWEGHGWPVVPKRILHPCGVMVEDDVGGRMAAAWLYQDNGGTGCCWMEWMVTNPALSPMKAAAALVRLFEAIQLLADNNDYGVIMTTARQASLVRLMEKCGFQKTDEGVTHLMFIRQKKGGN